MSDSISSNLKLWEKWAPPTKGPHFNLVGDRVPAIRSYTTDQSRYHFLLETLGRNSSNCTHEPYSLDWFLEIESIRYSRHGSWLPRVLEFSKHSGEKLLGIGSGLGTDWLQYAKSGAEVSICSPDADQRYLIQRHFDLRGYKGQFFQLAKNTIPLGASSIDVVFLTSLLQLNIDPSSIIEEIFRVLKPGGKVLAIARSYYDVNYWCYRWLPFHGHKGEQSGEKEPVALKRKHLKQLFNRFAEHHYYKRHLRRSDLPHICRLLPLPMLERIMGKYMVIKAFKPVSSVKQTSQAA